MRIQTAERLLAPATSQAEMACALGERPQAHPDKRLGPCAPRGRQRRRAAAQLPPPDLIVRPSGEQRLSNFILWEAAYAEFVFQDVLWPDYGPEHLKAAIAEYHTRDRRYGAVVTDDVLAAG